MSRGVPIHQLRCPTCGSPFDLRVQLVRHNPPYMVCHREHRWTLKMIERNVNQPDAVLLDRYTGGGALATHKETNP